MIDGVVLVVFGRIVLEEGYIVYDLRYFWGVMVRIWFLMLWDFMRLMRFGGLVVLDDGCGKFWGILGWDKIM